MLGIGTKHFLIAIHIGKQETGIFKAIELQANGVAALTKLRLQSAQIAFTRGIEEELQQQLNSGFG